MKRSAMTVSRQFTVIPLRFIPAFVFAVRSGIITPHVQIHFRYRRSRQFTRKRVDLRLSRYAPRTSRTQYPIPKTGSVHQCRSRSLFSRTTRRSLRSRRQHHRSRSRSLRTLYQFGADVEQQLDDRADLPTSFRAGAARGISRQCRASHSACSNVLTYRTRFGSMSEEMVLL